MNNTLILIAVMFLNLSFSTMMDFFAKQWSITDDIRYFYYSLLSASVTMVFYILMIKYGSLTISSSITLLLTMTISVSLGYFYFQERVEVIQWVGIVLGFIAIFLMLNIIKIK